jgi:hypothetical protein
VVIAIVGVFFAWKTYKHSKHTHEHTINQHNVDVAASSTTALTALPAGRAEGSIFEERDITNKSTTEITVSAVISNSSWISRRPLV